MRDTVKNLLDFYINSSIHVSIAIVCLAGVTFRNFFIPVEIDLLIFIFFGSVTAYNFVKYAGIAKLHHLSLAKNLRIIQMFSLLAFIGLVLSTFYQPLSVILVAFIMGGFTILYALPVFNNNRNLRGLPGVKIFVIAFVVSGVTVLMPLIHHTDIFSWDVFLEFLQRFTLVIVLILPFEIRDLRFDMAQLGTLPQKYGVAGTKIIGYALLSFIILVEFLKQDRNIESVLSLMLTGFLVFIFLKKSTINQGRYYSSFWVESIPVVWLAILIFLQKII